METSPLICSANQWTSFCMIGYRKELKLSNITVTKRLFFSKTNSASFYKQNFQILSEFFLIPL